MNTVKKMGSFIASKKHYSLIGRLGKFIDSTQNLLLRVREGRVVEGTLMVFTLLGHH